MRNLGKLCGSTGLAKKAKNWQDYHSVSRFCGVSNFMCFFTNIRSFRASSRGTGRHPIRTVILHFGGHVRGQFWGLNNRLRTLLFEASKGCPGHHVGGHLAGLPWRLRLQRPNAQCAPNWAATGLKRQNCTTILAFRLRHPSKNENVVPPSPLPPTVQFLAPVGRVGRGLDT